MLRGRDPLSLVSSKLTTVYPAFLSPFSTKLLPSVYYSSSGSDKGVSDRSGLKDYNSSIIYLHWWSKGEVGRSGIKVAGFKVWQTLNFISGVSRMRVWYWVILPPVIHLTPLVSKTACTWWGVYTLVGWPRVSLDASLTIRAVATTALWPKHLVVLRGKLWVVIQAPSFALTSQEQFLSFQRPIAWKAFPGSGGLKLGL